MVMSSRVTLPARKKLLCLVTLYMTLPSNADPEYQTPMMQQFGELKKQYPDCILFFRLGDFYELFLEDARIGSQILGITLTRRSRGKDGAIPMCGVPYHALDLYLPKLVEAGHKVAIAEQITSSTDTPHLVKRKVTRVVTSGTLLDARGLNEKQSSFVCTIKVIGKTIVLALADLATGEICVKRSSTSSIVDDVHQLSPKEILLSPKQYNTPNVLGLFEKVPTNIACFQEWDEWEKRDESVILKHFKLTTVHSFGFTHPSQTAVLATLIGYLSYTQQGQIDHVQQFRVLKDDRYLHIDAASLESLEIFFSSMDKTESGSLLSVADKTVTAMGGRLLRRWLAQPSCEKNTLTERLNTVQEFIETPLVLTKIQCILKEILDIERLLSKASIGICTARDLISLRYSLQQSEEACQLLKQLPSLQKRVEKISGSTVKVIEHIYYSIVDDPKGVTKEGGIIKTGVSQRLDQLKEVNTKNKEWLKEYEREQKKITGISTLKVSDNSVFGFYIEVSKGQTQLITPNLRYERRQTLVNAQRYTTQALKHRELEVIQAREEMNQLEYELFVQTTQYILTSTPAIQQMAQMIAYIDCLAGFAQVAREKQYTRPILSSDKVLEIHEGRHPVVEHFFSTDFVPNDTQLSQDHACILLTGPNMAGKSTYIRQVALICVLAQIGSYVPARSAKLPILDRIFARIGASDALHKGLSTFMVEMSETAHILKQVSDRSLIILDEVGRGTSTEDGLSIAQAVAEYLASIPQQPFVLFATHYHELSHLANRISRIQNFCMTVQHYDNSIVFLRKLQKGSSDQSFGIEIAKHAGLPNRVITRAEFIKRNFSLTHPVTSNDYQLGNKIINLNLDEITPKQAWEILLDLQKYANSQT